MLLSLFSAGALLSLPSLTNAACHKHSRLPLSENSLIFETSATAGFSETLVHNVATVSLASTPSRSPASESSRVTASYSGLSSHPSVSSTVSLSDSGNGSSANSSASHSLSSSSCTSCHSAGTSTSSISSTSVSEITSAATISFASISSANDYAVSFSSGTVSSASESSATVSAGNVYSGSVSTIISSPSGTASSVSSSASSSVSSSVSPSASSTADISGTVTSGTATSTIGLSTTNSSITVSSTTISSTTTSSSAQATFGNTASARSQWGNDFDISTDYYTEVPDTGVTREYWFELTETTASPDGVERFVIAINGSIPGPTITADWGDYVIVHLTNALTTSVNGTSLHFHGIRQNYTNDQDGVSSITQCPTPPGTSITYKWRATQYGTTWYHSHFALQAWQGVFGPIVINGPASANYDVDAGTIFLVDWTHQTPDELFESAATRGPPNIDNSLINGMNVYGDDDSSEQTGERWNMTFTPGTSYRMRVINGAIDSSFKFSIDNHTLTVIASDLVPIEPYTAEIITLGGGQRYDVIVTADQGAVADSFWMRSIPMSSCSSNTMKTNIKGIIYYEDSTTLPTTTGYDYVDACDDETDNLVPVVSQTVGAMSTELIEVASVNMYNGHGFRWFLNSTTMITDWADPSLLQLYNNVTEFESSNAVVTLDEANVWVYLIIETNFQVSHPIHLHGHDFVILAQGSGSFDDTVTLKTDNPPRRDVVMLPGSGYVAIAFYTDNPGAWLMHCHIGWHTSEGFALQFVERQSEIMQTVDTDRLQDTCDAWSEYQTAKAIVQEDSGI